MLNILAVVYVGISLTGTSVCVSTLCINKIETRSFETTGEVYDSYSYTSLTKPAIAISLYLLVNSTLLAVGEPVTVKAYVVYPNTSDSLIKQEKGVYLAIQGANAYPPRNVSGEDVPMGGEFFVNRQTARPKR